MSSDSTTSFTLYDSLEDVKLTHTGCPDDTSTHHNRWCTPDLCFCNVAQRYRTPDTLISRLNEVAESDQTCEGSTSRTSEWADSRVSVTNVMEYCLDYGDSKLDDIYLAAKEVQFIHYKSPLDDPPPQLPPEKKNRVPPPDRSHLPPKQSPDIAEVPVRVKLHKMKPPTIQIPETPTIKKRQSAERRPLSAAKECPAVMFLKGLTKSDLVTTESCNVRLPSKQTMTTTTMRNKTTLDRSPSVRLQAKPPATSVKQKKTEVEVFLPKLTSRDGHEVFARPVTPIPRNPAARHSILKKSEEKQHKLDVKPMKETKPSKVPRPTNITNLSHERKSSRSIRKSPTRLREEIAAYQNVQDTVTKINETLGNTIRQLREQMEQIDAKHRSPVKHVTIKTEQKLKPVEKPTRSVPTQTSSKRLEVKPPVQQKPKVPACASVVNTSPQKAAIQVCRGAIRKAEKSRLNQFDKGSVLVTLPGPSRTMAPTSPSTITKVRSSRIGQNVRQEKSYKKMYLEQIGRRENQLKELRENALDVGRIPSSQRRLSPPEAPSCRAVGISMKDNSWIHKRGGERRQTRDGNRETSKHVLTKRDESVSPPNTPNLTVFGSPAPVSLKTRSKLTQRVIRFQEEPLSHSQWNRKVQLENPRSKQSQYPFFDR